MQYKMDFSKLNELLVFEEEMLDAGFHDLWSPFFTEVNIFPPPCHTFDVWHGISVPTAFSLLSGR